VHSVGRKVAKARVLKRNLGTTRTNDESGKARGFIVVSNSRSPGGCHERSSLVTKFAAV